MPNVMLRLKCKMDGVTDLKPADELEFRWYLKLKCTSCGTAPEHLQYVSLSDVVDMPGGRSQCHMVEKCKYCGRVNTLEILPDTAHPYTSKENEQWQNIIAFDCRGIEPIDIDFTIGWRAIATDSDLTFDEVSFSDKMWVDYDEKADKAVEITIIEHKFETYKPKK